MSLQCNSFPHTKLSGENDYSSPGDVTDFWVQLSRMLRVTISPEAMTSHGGRKWFRSYHPRLPRSPLTAPGDQPLIHTSLLEKRQRTRLHGDAVTTTRRQRGPVSPRTGTKPWVPALAHLSGCSSGDGPSRSDGTALSRRDVWICIQTRTSRGETLRRQSRDRGVARRLALFVRGG